MHDWNSLSHRSMALWSRGNRHLGFDRWVGSRRRIADIGVVVSEAGMLAWPSRGRQWPRSLCGTAEAMIESRLNEPAVWGVRNRASGPSRQSRFFAMKQSGLAKSLIGFLLAVITLAWAGHANAGAHDSAPVTAIERAYDDERVPVFDDVEAGESGIEADRERDGSSPLASAPSPYLRSHAQDAVAWRLFDSMAFREARDSGRLVWISSGYYACYWCHVLQQETLRDADFAQAIERYFVPVIVDRELEPAVDSFLLEFLRSTRGFAGWPLNIVLTADGDPLTGLVYEPRESFKAFLLEVGRRYSADREGVTALARSAREALSTKLLEQQSQTSRRLNVEPELRARRAVELWLAAWAREADDFEGGVGQTAKYPRAPVLTMALALLEAPANRFPALDRRRHELREWLVVTLDSMVESGLMDPLDGGFYRYSETPDWATPHFEMMLDDQLRLAEVYERAAAVLETPAYAAIADQTIRTIRTQFALPQSVLVETTGGMTVDNDRPTLMVRRLASGLSAIDRDGVEGGDVLVSVETVDRALRAVTARGFGDQIDALRDALGLSGSPPFAAGYLLSDRRGLSRRLGDADRAESANHELQQAWQVLAGELRSARGIAPRLRDDKALTGLHAAWVALWADTWDKTTGLANAIGVNGPEPLATSALKINAGVRVATPRVQGPPSDRLRLKSSSAEMAGLRSDDHGMVASGESTNVDQGAAAVGRPVFENDHFDVGQGEQQLALSGSAPDDSTLGDPNSARVVGASGALEPLERFQPAGLPYSTPDFRLAIELIDRVDRALTEDRPPPALLPPVLMSPGHAPRAESGADVYDDDRRDAYWSRNTETIDLAAAVELGRALQALASRSADDPSFAATLITARWAARGSDRRAAALGADGCWALSEFGASGPRDDRSTLAAIHSAPTHVADAASTRGETAALTQWGATATGVDDVAAILDDIKLEECSRKLAAELAARTPLWLDAIHRWYAEDEGWRVAQELPLPAMTAQRYMPGVHSHSPSALWLRLVTDWKRVDDLGVVGKDSRLEDRRVTQRLIDSANTVRNWPVAIAVERDLLAHSDLIAVWLADAK